MTIVHFISNWDCDFFLKSLEKIHFRDYALDFYLHNFHYSLNLTKHHSTKYVLLFPPKKYILVIGILN